MRDAAGNITSSSGFQIPVITTADAGDTGYSYTANRLVSTAGRSYLYDSAGNILSDGIRTFVYNQDNRLIRVSINGVVAGEYAYDAFGRRVKKVASGTTTLYRYDSSGKLIAETDGNGNPQRDYVYLNGEPVALKLYGSQAGMYFFINDHLGTPQKIVNSAGQVVWGAAYLPFGKAQVKPETVTNNLRFPGQYFDAESGLHYNWHRYYDPETGRYVTADPIGLSGGINLYVYVMGNPLNRSDYTGMLVVDDYWFDPDLKGKLYYALAKLRDDVKANPCVKKLFGNLGVDIDDILTPGRGPTLYAENLRGGPLGMYEPKTKKIRIFSEVFTYYHEAAAATIIHELAHWAYDVADRDNCVTVIPKCVPPRWQVVAADGDPYGYAAEIALYGRINLN